MTSVSAAFTGGDHQTYSVSLGVRTGPRFITTFDFTNTGVEADWERFNTTLGRLKMNYFFTPYRFIEAFLQYNSRSQQFSSNIRGWTTTSGTGL